VVDLILSLKGLTPATTLTFLIMRFDPIIQIDLGFHVLSKYVYGVLPVIVLPKSRECVYRVFPIIVLPKS
jgi:hypothetical protein